MSKGFVVNAAKLASGAAVSQVIGLAFYPILTRLYSPADFGVFSLVFTTAGVFGAALCLRYEQAIVLAPTPRISLAVEKLAQNLQALLALFSVLVLAVLSWILRPSALPMSVTLLTCAITMGYLTSASQVYQLKFIRRQGHAKVAIGRSIKGLTVVLTQAALALVLTVSHGLLISGELLALAISLGFYYLTSARLHRGADQKFATQARRLSSKIAVAKRYRKQPISNLPQILTNTLTAMITVFAISSLFNVQQAGQFFLMQRIVFLPSSLLGTAISQEYLRESSRLRSEIGMFQSAFNTASKLLFGAALPVFLILVFAGEQVFTYVLGSQWQMAGALSQIFAPYIFIHFVISGLGVTAMVAGRQERMLVVGITQNLIWLCGILIGAQIFENDLTRVIQITVFISVPYMFGIFLWYRKLSRTADA